MYEVWQSAESVMYFAALRSSFRCFFSDLKLGILEIGLKNYKIQMINISASSRQGFYFFSTAKKSKQKMPPLFCLLNAKKSTSQRKQKKLAFQIRAHSKSVN